MDWQLFELKQFMSKHLTLEVPRNVMRRWVCAL